MGFKELKTGIQIEINISEKIEELKIALVEKEYISDLNQSVNNLTFSMKSENDYSDLFELLKKFPIKKINHKEYGLDDIFLKLTKDR